ncbi:MAG: cupin domain-containing protein [Thermoanaerobaculia bacterium]
MKGYVTDIEKATVENDNFEKVLFTSRHHQLVVMSLAPGEDIGSEVHDDLDQFTRIEQGDGIVEMDGERMEIHDDFAFIVPAGTRHNVINTSGERPLKLYSVYSSPDHPDGEVLRTKAERDQ